MQCCGVLAVLLICIFVFLVFLCTCYMFKNSIGDAHTPQQGENIFDTMRYRRSERKKDKETFRAKCVSYIKVQIMFKYRK